jgi:hypothetical protein
LKAAVRRSTVVGIDALAYYTLELTRPEDGWSQLPQLTADARQASEEMQRSGIEVRFLRSVFLPDEDACFYLYQASSAAAVRAAAERASLAINAISAAGKSLPRPVGGS